MTKHPNTAALLVLGAITGAAGIHEASHFRAIPVTVLPLCDEVGEALHTMPPMATAQPPETSEIAPATAENAPETRETLPRPTPAVTPEITPAAPRANAPQHHPHRRQHVTREVPATQPAAESSDVSNLWDKFVAWLKNLCTGAP